MPYGISTTPRSSLAHSLECPTSHDVGGSRGSDADTARTRILIHGFTLSTDGAVGHGPGQQGCGGTALFCCLWRQEKPRPHARLDEPRQNDGLAALPRKSVAASPQHHKGSSLWYLQDYHAYAAGATSRDPARRSRPLAVPEGRSASVRGLLLAAPAQCCMPSLANRAPA